MAGNFTPQRVQNLVIRDYCERAGGQFLLSATEYYMDNCFLMLKALQEDQNSFDGVVFYCMDHLPSEKEIIKEVLNSFLKNNKEIHFALERISIKSVEDLHEFLDMILVKELRKNELSLI